MYVSFSCTGPAEFTFIGCYCNKKYEFMCDLRWLLEEPEHFFKRVSTTKRSRQVRAHNKRQEAKVAKREEKVQKACEKKKKEQKKKTLSLSR